MVRIIVSLPEEDKKWLEYYGRKHRLSAAEVIRRALKLYRRQVSQGGYERVIRETAGAWKSVKVDSQEYIEAMRADWEKTS
jgi:Arc/MetJ-type ribon-helix-helix transcriptional regulator